MIIKIVMKEETTKRTFLQLTSWLDRHGKLISNAERTNGNHFVAIACFDDKLDYLAFLVSTGLCHLIPVPPNAPSAAELIQAGQEDQP